MRGHPDYSNKDYVLGGTYEPIVDGDGIYKVVMKLVVKLLKPSDFGVYKCIAKNSLGNSEEIIKVLRKFLLRVKLLNASWQLIHNTTLKGFQVSRYKTAKHHKSLSLIRFFFFVERFTRRLTASKVIESQWFHPTGFVSGTLLTKNGKQNSRSRSPRRYCLANARLHFKASDMASLTFLSFFVYPFRHFLRRRK